MKTRPLPTTLPCPFCGAMPILFPQRPDIEGNAWGAVTCMNETCRVRPSAQWFDDRGTHFCHRKAILDWNRRF